MRRPASLAADQPVIQELSLEVKRKRDELEIYRMDLEMEEMRAELEAKKRAYHAKNLADIAAYRAAEIANQNAEQEQQIKVTANYIQVCQDTTMDERARLIFKDNYLNMIMLQGSGAQGLLTDGQPSIKPVSLSNVADKMGLKFSSNELKSIGKEVSKRYYALHGKRTTKHDQLCEGRMTSVNSYTESDRGLVEDVIQWHLNKKK